MQPDLTLYLVTDSTGLEEDVFLDKIQKACEGGITLLQLREKEKEGRAYMALAEKVKKITDAYQIPLIIDDRVDVAMAVNAAGVHLGQRDLPVAVARRLMGPDKIVGATTKTIEQAMIAKREGANYLGVGAIFPTTTKVRTILTKVETLNEIKKCSQLPVVAIGGLRADNCQILHDSLADGLAVVSAIMKAEDPRRSAALLKEKVMNGFL